MPPSEEVKAEPYLVGLPVSILEAPAIHTVLSGYLVAFSDVF